MSFKTIGWIGTGVMGRSMCGHLLDAKFNVYVYNRSKNKSASLLEKGAHWCDTPKQVAEKADIIFTIVGYPQDVEAVYLGPDGIIESAKPGTVLVDMTTSEPALAREIARVAAQKSISLLDAPVSGGDVGAKEAKLAIMVGGETEIFKQVMPLFGLMGENIALMGPAGSGQHTKMCNQILIASSMIGTVESLLYAQKAGLDPDAMIDIVGKGAAASWSINNLGRRIVKKNFDPGFFIKHFVKDMGIALKEAQRMKLSLPGLALAHQFYVAAMAQGHENLGTQGLYKVFEQMNRIPIEEIK